MNLLHDIILTYLDSRAIHIRYSTYMSYRYLLAYVPNIPINQLSLDSVQAIIDDMVRAKLSSSTISHVLVLLRLVCRYAYKRGLISDYSYLDNVERPRQRKTEIRAYSADDVKKIIINRQASIYGDFFCALLLTGCRVSELINLKWADVDICHRVLLIRSAKTAAGVREIPISDMLILMFPDSAYIGNTVFCNSFGQIISYRSLLEAWHRYTDYIGIERGGLHKLRHTYATFALRAGVDVKTLSELLGHRDVSTTLQIYCNVDIDDKRKAAELTTQLITGNS